MEYKYSFARVSGQITRIHHTKGAELPKKLVLVAKPETKEVVASNGEVYDTYQFSNNSANAFFSINAEDKERLADVRVREDGYLCVIADIIVEPSVAEVSKLPKFLGGAK